MTATKTYNPTDLDSSPYEPMIGSIVLFKSPKNGALGQQIWPAIITAIHETEDDRVSLTVFTTYGPNHVSRIPYSADPTRDGVWFWAEAPKRRPVALQDEPVAP